MELWLVYGLMADCMQLLQQENASSSLSVLHIQYGEWPDDGVPSDTVAVRYILRRLCNLPPNLGPIAVDCR